MLSVILTRVVNVTVLPGLSSYCTMRRPKPSRRRLTVDLSRVFKAEGWALEEHRLIVLFLLEPPGTHGAFEAAAGTRWSGKCRRPPFRIRSMSELLLCLFSRELMQLLRHRLSSSSLQQHEEAVRRSTEDLSGAQGSRYLTMLTF